MSARGPSGYPTDEVIRKLRRAGFRPAESIGAHTLWCSELSSRRVVLADGHRSLSPSAYHMVVRIVEESCGSDGL